MEGLRFFSVTAGGNSRDNTHDAEFVVQRESSGRFTYMLRVSAAAGEAAALFDAELPEGTDPHGGATFAIEPLDFCPLGAVMDVKSILLGYDLGVATLWFEAIGSDKGAVIVALQSRESINIETDGKQCRLTRQQFEAVEARLLAAGVATRCEIHQETELLSITITLARPLPRNYNNRIAACRAIADYFYPAP